MKKLIKESTYDISINIKSDNEELKNSILKLIQDKEDAEYKDISEISIEELDEADLILQDIDNERQDEYEENIKEIVKYIINNDNNLTMLNIDYDNKDIYECFRILTRRKQLNENVELTRDEIREIAQEIKKLDKKNNPNLIQRFIKSLYLKRNIGIAIICTLVLGYIEDRFDNYINTKMNDKIIEKIEYVKNKYGLSSKDFDILKKEMGITSALTSKEMNKLKNHLSDITKKEQKLVHVNMNETVEEKSKLDNILETFEKMVDKNNDKSKLINIKERFIKKLIKEGADEPLAISLIDMTLKK